MKGYFTRKACAIALSALLLMGTGAFSLAGVQYPGVLKVSAYTYGSFEYESDYYGNITITSYTGSRQNVVIPSEIDGDPVKKIGMGAFENSSVKTVTVSEGITEIDETAFTYCMSLQTVSLPSTLTKIGNSAFSVCTSLRSVDIPDSVTNIEKYAFNGCSSLTSARLPSGISTIKEGTFKGCSSLNNIAIPSYVYSIDNSAFANSGLTSITLPNLIDSI